MAAKIDLDVLYGNREAITVSSPQLAWDLVAAAPDVASALAQRSPGALAVCDAFKERLPHPSSRGFITADPFIRPMGHGRCFYLNIDALNGVPQSGYLAIKGTEVVTRDYVAWMKQLRGRSRYWTLRVGTGASLSFPMDSEINELDRWPVLERKVPGGVTFAEAMGEAAAALELQKAHLGRYGELARVPLPLLVFKWPDEVAARVVSDLKPLLSHRGAEIVENTVKLGLGSYVYFYPSLPIRLLDWSVERLEGVEVMIDRLDYVGRQQKLRNAGFDVEDIVGKWTALFVRMLALGFLPKDFGSLLTADCMQPWNIALDGGFLDVDSVVAAKDMDDKLFRDTLRRSIRALVFDISYFMMGKVVMAVEFRDRYPEMTWIIMNELKRRLRAEAKVGEISERVMGFFESDAMFADLDQLFRVIA